MFEYVFAALALVLPWIVPQLMVPIGIVLVFFNIATLLVDRNSALFTYERDTLTALLNLIFGTVASGIFLILAGVTVVWFVLWLAINLVLGIVNWGFLLESYASAMEVMIKPRLTLKRITKKRQVATARREQVNRMVDYSTVASSANLIPRSTVVEVVDLLTTLGEISEAEHELLLTLHQQDIAHQPVFNQASVPAYSQPEQFGVNGFNQPPVQPQRPAASPYGVNGYNNNPAPAYAPQAPVAPNPYGGFPQNGQGNLQPGGFQPAPGGFNNGYGNPPQNQYSAGFNGNPPQDNGYGVPQQVPGFGYPAAQPVNNGWNSPGNQQNLYQQETPSQPGVLQRFLRWNKD